MMKHADLIGRLRDAARTTISLDASKTIHEAADALEEHRDCHNLGITEPKSSVRWEYGIMRDQATPKSSRKAAEEEIERQRDRKSGHRITGQRLVRRLVSTWEEVVDRD